MKKMLTALFALCVVGSAAVYAAGGTTHTEQFVNKKANELAKPVADKEKELSAKQAAAEKERAAKEAEKAQKAQQVNKDVNNLKNSVEAFNKYKK